MFAGLRLRMGMHYGPVDNELNPVTGRVDYRGGTVNKAARIEPQALHGMTAFSQELKDAVMTSGADISCLGKKTLKGIGEVELYYVLTKALTGRQANFNAQISCSIPVMPLNLKQRQSSYRGTVKGSESGTIAGKTMRTAKSATGKGLAASHLERNLRKDLGAVVVINLLSLQTRAMQAFDARVVLKSVNMCAQMALDNGGMTEGKLEFMYDSTLVMSWGIGEVWSSSCVT